MLPSPHACCQALVSASNTSLIVSPFYPSALKRLGETRWDAGFNREARKAILELTGKVDGLAPLDDLLARLFPHYDSLPNNER